MTFESKSLPNTAGQAGSHRGKDWLIGYVKMRHFGLKIPPQRHEKATGHVEKRFTRHANKAFIFLTYKEFLHFKGGKKQQQKMETVIRKRNIC